MDFRDMNESELKAFLDEFLEPDFNFVTEVEGCHIVERVKVKADYILRPKPHLVKRGFDDEYFAIEVKSPKNANPHSQYRKALVQSASYVDSCFGARQIRPMFSLIFPNMDYFTPLDPDDNIHLTEVKSYFTLAQYLNVGDLRVNPTAKKNRWSIWFSGGRYYCVNKGRGKHNLTQRYVGNVA